MASSKYILWLPSWYPNKYEPYNGDFVQRHAQAASCFCSIVVCHFPQTGEKEFIAQTYQEIKENGQLKEIVCYNAFKPLGIKPIDKIRYNLTYYKNAFRFLEAFFKKVGLPEIVHVHVPMKAGIIARWIKYKYGIDFLVTEHSSYYVKSAPNNFFKRDVFFRNQTKKIFQKASLVTTVSNAISTELARLFKLNRVEIIRNVVDTNCFYYSKEKEPIFTFIHVSSFSVEKNIDRILLGFKSLRQVRNDWKVWFLGPHEQKHIDFTIENNLEDVVGFFGEVAHTSVAELMQKAHCLVLFSKIENFPCVIIEALCCGLPVISSNVGGVSEAVNDSNGILVASENDQDFVQALENMICNYSIYNCKSIAEEAALRYSNAVIGKQLFNLYSTISNSKR